MQKRTFKTVLRMILALAILVTILPVGTLPAKAEEEAHSSLPTIEEQIRAYADSIDQADAVDAAASALALHGITMGGRTLYMDEDNALTAVLWNSEVLQVAATETCVAAIEYMQMLDQDYLPYLKGGCSWNGANSSYSACVYTADDWAIEYRGISFFTYRQYTGTQNSYDGSLEWMVGLGDSLISLQRKRVTQTEATYEVTYMLRDRFDFDTSQGSGFSQLISGMGALLFREFDWESTVTFELTVPYSCDHSTQMYHLTYDAENRIFTSDTSGLYTERMTYEEYAGEASPYYHKLGKTIRLYHDKPWVMEYTVRNSGHFVIAPIERFSLQNLCLMNYSNSGLMLQKRRVVDGYTIHDCYGVRFDGWLSNNVTYTFRLENEIDANGNNMIFLTIVNADSQAIVLEKSPMDDYYENVGGTLTLKDSSSSYLSGVDLFINYIGTKDFSFHADYFELRIWENGEDGENSDYFEETVVPPTCDADGYTAHTCSACGYSYKTDIVAAFGHSFGDWYTVTAATCTEMGTEARDCATCFAHETRENAALGHAYEAVVTSPTCTEQGYTTHTCANCGDSYMDSYLDANGHIYSAWYATVEVTCTMDGEQRRDCENCDHFEKAVLPKTGHSYGEWYVVTENTCTRDGLRRHDCENCDRYETEVLPKTGHQYGEWYVVTEATCQKEGLQRHDCQNCSRYETATIPIVDHHYVDGLCEYCGEVDLDAVMMGDANGDGRVDYLDAMLIAQYYVGLITDGALNVEAADVNGDGTVNYLDAMMVAQYYVGLLDSFPAEK